MKAFRLMGLCLCLLLLGAAVEAQKSANDSLRQDIEAARTAVYPALVNITVVMRYYSDGRAQRAPAGGSGVIVSKDGYVLTNFHVAGHTTRITCTMPDGEAIDASVVLHDPLTDLSVLKLRLDKRANPSAPIPYANLGDSDKMQVGDYVLAMGNPLMLSSSMTLGIISNTKRVFTDFTGTDIEDMALDEGETTGLLTRWLQHDALILPGNSGGPLVNLKGEVVGINELGGGGVGFAIPSNIAASVLKQALSGSEARRGWLGFSILPVSKMDRTTGVLIANVLPSSPAEKAGLMPGDIILSLNDEPITVRFFEEVPLLYQRVAALPIGQTVKIQYLRNNEPRAATATVAQMERSLGKEVEYRAMGITVQEITGPMALVRHYPDKNGVLVTGVRTGYPFEAAQPALTAGDVILSVGGTPTSDLEAFRKVMAGAEKRDAVVAFRRDKEQMVTLVKAIPDKPTEEGGELPKAWIGIKTQVLITDIAKAMNLEGTKGFRITEVYPWTEANKAGLKPGDIITALNKDKMTASRPQDAEDLKRAVEDLNVGEKADLTVLRDDKPMHIAVTLEAEPVPASQAKKARQKEFEFAVREITPLDRLEQNWPKDQKGLMVTEVTQGGWASMSGLHTDDLLISVNGQDVTDVSSFESRLKEILAQKPKIVQMFVRRGYKTHFVFIEPEWSRLTDAD